MEVLRTSEKLAKNGGQRATNSKLPRHPREAEEEEEEEQEEEEEKWWTRHDGEGGGEATAAAMREMTRTEWAEGKKEKEDGQSGPKETADRLRG